LKLFLTGAFHEHVLAPGPRIIDFSIICESCLSRHVSTPGGPFWVEIERHHIVSPTVNTRISFPFEDRVFQKSRVVSL